MKEEKGKKKRKELFFEDWLDRGEDFVSRKGERSGWNSKYSTSAGYITGGISVPKEAVDQYRKIYQLCSNRLKILSSLGGNKNRLTLALNSATDRVKATDKIVKIDSSIIDDKESTKSFEEKADILMGMTTHELGHVIHSDFNILAKLPPESFERAIYNVIEDERIERLLTEEFPGYGDNIARMKEYMFDELAELKETEESGELSGKTLTDEQKNAIELFNLFMSYVRYPSKVDEDTAARHETTMDEIKQLLTPYPSTPYEVLNVSRRIITILDKAMEEPPPPTGGGGGDDDKNDESEEGKDGGSPKGGSGDDGKEDGSSKKPKNDKKKSSDTKKEIKDMKDFIGNTMKAIESANDKSANPDPNPQAGKIDYSKPFEEDPENFSEFISGSPNESRYKRLLQQVRGDAKRLASSLFTRVFNENKLLRGMRSGELDDYKIVEAAHGAKNVYNQKIEKESRKLNIVVLIDESGSMGSINTAKTDAAASCGIILEEAFRTFNVGQLFIYGFTEGRVSGSVKGENVLYRYKEPGYYVKYGLGDVQGRSGNRDGQCIRAAAKRVRKFTKEPAIFFIISDGQPAYSVKGKGKKGYLDGREDTRDAAKEISKDKFFPIQIGIGRDISESDQAFMFEDFVHYDDPSQMVNDLRKLIVRKAHKIFNL